MAMSDSSGSKWQARVLNAVVLLLLVAVGARVAWELLAPLVPWLLLIGFFAVIFAVLFGKLSR
jgi:hypothetical protein